MSELMLQRAMDSLRLSEIALAISCIALFVNISLLVFRVYLHWYSKKLLKRVDGSLLENS